MPPGPCHHYTYTQGNPPLPPRLCNTVSLSNAYSCLLALHLGHRRKLRPASHSSVIITSESGRGRTFGITTALHVSCSSVGKPSMVTGVDHDYKSTQFIKFNASPHIMEKESYHLLTCRVHLSQHLSILAVCLNL